MSDLPKLSPEFTEKSEPIKPAPITVVAEQFPRIAIRIEMEWGYPSLHTYLESIIIDDRGNRTGFPPAVMAALLSIYNEHADEFNFKPTPTRWW